MKMEMSLGEKLLETSALFYWMELNHFI